MSQDTQHIRLKQAGVHADVVDDEAIVISFATGRYYTIRGTGAYIIGALARGPVEIGSVLTGLAMIYSDVPIEKLRTDLHGFRDELLREGLIERYAWSGAETEVKFRGAYGFQPIEIEARLADILTLDPIHEVSAEGWPNRS